MPNQMTNVPTEKQRALTMYHAGCRKLVMFTNSCGEAWMTAEGISSPVSTARKTLPETKSFLLGCAPRSFSGSRTLPLHSTLSSGSCSTRAAAMKNTSRRGVGCP